MEDWGELALMYLDEVDPTAVWGIDLADVVDTLRAGGFTRVEAGAVARWLFACLPAHSSDGSRRAWRIADIEHETNSGVPEQVPPPTIH